MSDLRDTAARLLALIEKTHEDNSPALKELWPAYWTTEAKHLRSAVRSQWAWNEMRGRAGSDGVELQERRALAVTTEIVEDVRASMRSQINRRGRPNSPGTVNRNLIVLRRLLNWAHEARKIPYNPLASLKMEEENNVRQTVIRTEAEFEALLSKCNRLVRALVLVLFDGGLRRMEAWNLRRDQVIKKPDGGAVIMLPASETKNKTPRCPRITKRAVDALEAIPSGSVYYFSKPSGARYSIRYAYSLFQKAVAKSGLKAAEGETIVLHSLRHSFAYVRRVRDHWPETRIMRAGGWKTAATMRRYGIVDDAEMDEAMGEVEARIASDAQCSSEVTKK